jgi:hypothetical protein
LGNPEVRRIVEQAVQENLTEYLELHPDVLDSILSKSLNALKVPDSCNNYTFVLKGIFFISYLLFLQDRFPRRVTPFVAGFVGSQAG